jgi:hypothetical protein
VFSIACGYPDANDSARLGADPIHKMLLDRDPVTGLDLASQPMLSRFENAAGAKQLYRMGEALAGSVIERHAQRLRGHARAGHAWHAATCRSERRLVARRRRAGMLLAESHHCRNLAACTIVTTWLPELSLRSILTRIEDKQRAECAEEFSNSVQFRSYRTS